MTTCKAINIRKTWAKVGSWHQERKLNIPEHALQPPLPFSPGRHSLFRKRRIFSDYYAFPYVVLNEKGLKLWSLEFLPLSLVTAIFARMPRNRDGQLQWQCVDNTWTIRTTRIPFIRRQKQRPWVLPKTLLIYGFPARHHRLELRLWTEDIQDQLRQKTFHTG